MERGLKTEKRIGPQAYLSPGGALCRRTLARDDVPARIGIHAGLPTPLMDGVVESNAAHRGWARRRLESDLGDLTGTKVAVWGLTYKPARTRFGGPTPAELCRWLVSHGASVHVHDPRRRRCLKMSLSPAMTIHLRLPQERALVLATAAGLPPWMSIDLRPLHPLWSGCQSISRCHLGHRCPLSLCFSRTATGMSQPLTGRNAIITGANQGLGLAIAHAYVAAGASVLLCARDGALLDDARRLLAAKQPWPVS